MINIPIEISARHLHVSKEDLDKLFGKNYKLTKKKSLTQAWEFATNETVEIQSDKGKIKKVRIIAPIRDKTQLEISKTDAFNLGINVPFGHSGKIKGTSGMVLIGEKGKLKMARGVIIPLRHIHLSPEEAKKNKLKDGQIVSVKVEGKRSIIFQNILVRIGKDYSFCLHLDVDEGNAAGIKFKSEGKIV
ncbi:MAG: phosphate propanoyltransferase [Candidatus Nealsonbacteria bacterium]